MSASGNFVIPAHAGTQGATALHTLWVPACAGMTGVGTARSVIAEPAE